MKEREFIHLFRCLNDVGWSRDCKVGKKWQEQMENIFPLSAFWWLWNNMSYVSHKFSLQLYVLWLRFVTLALCLYIWRCIGLRRGICSSAWPSVSRFKSDSEDTWWMCNTCLYVFRAKCCAFWVQIFYISLLKWACRSKNCRLGSV